MSDNHHPLVSYARLPDAAIPQYPTPSNDSEGDAFPISIRQITAIYRTYWRISAAVFAGTFIAVMSLMLVVPKSYSAIATMMVDFHSPDPLATKDLSDFGPGSYLPTQIELMQSDAVLEGVIERLDLTSKAEYTKGHKAGDDSLYDWISIKLRKNLDIEPGRSGSQLIYVTATASTANMAADIANALADSFLSQTVSDKMAPTADSIRRYDAGLASLKSKVEAAQVALTEFRNRSGAVNFDGKTDMEEELLSSLEHRLLEARNSLRSTEARSAGKNDVTTAMLASPTVTGLREEGNKLAARMAQLKTEFGPNHPEVVALQAQIDANKAARTSAQNTFSSATSSDSAVLSKEVQSLESAVAAQRAKVLRLNQYRDQAGKYQVELESAQAVYKRALDGYDQHQFAATGQSSRIRVASKARPPIKASQPSLKKFLSGGFGGGLVLALALPFVLELPRRRIRCEDDLERDMKIPVLIQLPYIPDTQLTGGRSR
jgi:succinoglycan biosynthesis transport protein ExoP